MAIREKSNSREISELTFLCEHLTNSFLASGDFFHRLTTFTNSLDPDQSRQNESNIKHVTRATTQRVPTWTAFNMIKSTFSSLCARAG